VTQISLVRGDNGAEFAMFLQVFADGTVIDGTGVHRIGPEALRPIAQLIQAGEITRFAGHCGSPPTDFTEYVHLIMYERYRGRLRANSFSYSGNPQGCDASVRQLHAALTELQNKISGPPSATPAAAAPPSAAPSVAPPSDAPSIPLTPGAE
jgi:hypothetical protein